MRIIKNGFSLMEMMVVLVIVAIIAAISAPMINKKAIEKASTQTPWVYTLGNSIAFGLGEKGKNKTVYIGRIMAPEEVQKPKLYIEAQNMPQIALGNMTTDPHRLWTNDSNGIILSKGNISEPKSNSVSIGTESNFEKAIAIGDNSGTATNAVAIGTKANASESAVAIGASAKAGNNAISIGQSAGNNTEKAVAIGHNATANTSTVTIGYGAKAQALSAIAVGDTASADEAGIAMGYKAVADEKGIAIGGGDDDGNAQAGAGTVAIGFNAQAASDDKGNLANNAVIIGNNAQSFENAIAIGNSANAAKGAIAIGSAEADTTVGAGCVAIGNAVNAVGDENNKIYSVAIGNSSASGLAGTAIGNNANAIAKAKAEGEPEGNSTAIGNNAKAEGANSLAIGYDAQATGVNSLAIGYSAQVTGDNSLAIGNSAKVEGDNIFQLGTIEHSVAIPSKEVYIGNTVNDTDEENQTGTDDEGGGEINLGHENTTVNIPGTLKVKKLDLSELTGTIQLGAHTATIYIPGRLVVAKHAILGEDNSSNNNYRTWIRMYDTATNTRVLREINGGSGEVLTPGEFYDGEIQGFTVDSDRRLKNVGEVFTAGLEEIKKLELFHYTYKKDPNKTPQVGVMAQDLQKIFPTAVFKGDDGFLRIRWDEMFFALINAIKELDAKIEKIIAEHKKVVELEKDVADWKKQNAELADEIAELKKEFKDVQKDIKRLKKKKISE